MIHSEKLLQGEMCTLTCSASGGTSVSLSCSATGQTGTNTLTVPKGSTISYSIPAYGSASSKSGSVTMDSNKTLTATYSSSTSYTDIPWSAPHNLTGPVAAGGNAFAPIVTLKSNGNEASLSGEEAWHVFDGYDPTKSGHNWESTTAWPKYIGFYNPVPVKLTQITITGMKSTQYFAPTKAILQGSNNNTTYIDLITYEGNKVNELTFDVNINNYYYYYRFYMTAGGYSNYIVIREIYADGYYQSTTTTYYWDISIS